MARLLLPLLVLIGLVGCRTSTPVNLAPVYQHETTPTLAMTRVGGPVYEASDADGSRSLFAIRPFYSMYRDDALDTTARDIMWPLYWQRENPQRDYRYGLLILYQSRETKATGEAQRWFIPVYFRHTSPEGKNTYAIFPFGGKLVNFAGYDEVKFVLWPIYVTTKKGATESTAWGWPFYSKTQGGATAKTRYFPFYGEAEKPGGWTNHFILWPFIHYGNSTNPEQPGSGWGVLPFYAQLDWENPERQTYIHNRNYLWPFFSTIRTHDSSRTLAPWPFYQRTQNYPTAGDNRRYFWPIWGQRQTTDSRSNFLFWPIFSNAYETTPAGNQIERHYGFPFYWHIRHTDAADQPTLEYRRIWPFYSTDEAGEHRRIKVFDLWPLRQHDVIERNYAPFWTLYEYQRKGDRRQHDLFWGWWQYRRTDAQVERASLFPLFSFRREDDGSSGLSLLCGMIKRHKQADAADTSTRWFWIPRSQDVPPQTPAAP